MTSCGMAIKQWEAKHEMSAEDAETVKLFCQIPPITKLDNSLNTLKNCEQLSLSTNAIDRLIPLAGMKKLRILSLGRNQIKKIEKLDDVAETLEELWISYNQITSLDGLASLTNLTTLYISNNQIKSWSELDKLQALPKLRDVLFVGNPIYENMSKDDARIEVLRHLPNVAKIDGDMVKPSERDRAEGADEEGET
uniref:Dynein axonemal light chain 1 n=1 Tax=Fibrocapsa japonica TaxID=94617 RepID=A0A6U1PP98_9STRA|mmetsp:Transcript_5123/g.7801  ORF Transcript_5123/g.7801 Transcript_5123/m.7801 type:complete len:195 (+) Transcript_5123:95-679(+)|eukprot:CAMPEP_0113934192 /NCGR_PEP_ID=MMETSP1339-20121228/1532_1 /TAXON_ID=94617 /ORGANISM="Fibrocapsa japonica" /LENGTH=194 /DNA_ID=CAMNT_0000935887 /DNA_START=119 /DNA_END=703 /DNA_ORIENTATION=- /assembly_acc=CAM_ASM_000762